MNRIKHFLILFFVIGSFFVSECFGQGSSNKGTDFWLGYGKHISVGNMVLYITSDVNTTSTVTIPALGFSQTVNITANTVQFVDIPTTAHLNTDGLSANGIHVTSLKPVIVYAHIYQTSVSGATLVLPVNTLGKDYYSINYKQESNATNSVSWFFVVAVEDNTQVEITPSATTQSGWAANSTHTVPLKKGEIYNVLGTYTNSGTLSNGVDLTGSRIKSISSNGTCKKIAVFSGSSKIAINCLTFNYNGITNPGSADNLFQQAYPTATWGKTFITVPHKDRNFVIYRIIKSDPSAVVTLNGTIIQAASFVNNFYYEFASQKVDEISADKPIQLVQYAVTQGKTITCATGVGDVGDPEMIFLNPLEQTLTKITMYSTPRFVITKHFINVVIKNTGVASFKLDGVNVSNQFIAVPNNANYSYSQLSVAEGTHNLLSDVGFNATAYGFGNAESYGYAAGANLTAFGIEPINSTSALPVETGCVNTKYNLYVNLPYQPVEIYIDKGDGNGSKIINPLNLISQTTKDGQTTYKYDLLPNLIYSNPATYTYKVRAIKPTIDDCGTGDEFTFDFIINPLPIAAFTVAAESCIKNQLAFNYTVNANQTITDYLWDFNGEGSSKLANPKYTYNTIGVKKNRLSVKSAEGCWSDIKEIETEVFPKPVANFTQQNITCAGADIQFTDQSSLAKKTITSWQWDFGDPASTTNTSTNQNPTHIFSQAKTYNVTLIVATDLGCKDTIVKQLKINSLPIVDFDGPNVCINNPTAIFTNKSTITDATVLTYVWDFGDNNSSPANNTSTATNPSHTYSEAKDYSVTLTAKSANGCVTTFVKTITIYPKPTANFNAPAQSCLNDVVSFTDIPTGTTIQIAAYLWDFNGEGNSTIQNPTFKFLIAGKKTINYSVRSQEGCWSDVVTKNIEIMQLPVVSFKTSIITCLNQAIQFTDASSTVGQTIVKWEWDFGDGNPISNDQNPTHVFTNSKTFDVKLKVTTNLGCSNTKIIQLIINPLPFPNFDAPPVCIYDPFALFTNTSTIADNSTLTYSWDFGDPASGANNTSTDKNPKHSYTQANRYNISLKVTSASGCVFSTTKPFIVSPRPIANFSVAPNTCLGDVTAFSNTAVSGQTITDYLWDFNSEGIATIKDPTFQFLSAGKKTINYSVRSQEGCWSDVVTKNIEIMQLPVVAFKTSLITCLNQAIQFTNATTTVGQNIASWEWDFGDGSAKSNIQNPTHTFNTVDNYSVTLTVTTNLGCTNKLVKQVKINPLPKVDFETPEICLDDALATFTNKTTIEGNTIITYLWDFGDVRPGSVNTSELKNPSHKYIAAANYIVKLKTTSDKGCVTELIKTFTVNGSTPKALFIPQNENSLCVNQPVIFKDISTIDFGEITKIEWYYDDATPTVVDRDNTPNLRSAVAKNYSHTYPIFYSPAQRSVNVKMVAYSGNSATCISSITKTIILKAAPIANFTTPDGCLPNGEAQFNDASIFLGSNNGFTYLWDFGDAGSSTNTSTLNNPTHVYSRADNYLVKLIATSSNGCLSELTKTFTVIGSVPKSKFIVQNEGVLCADKPVIFEEKATVDFGELAKVEWIYDDSNPTVVETDNKPGLRSAASKVYTHLYPVFYSPAQKVVNVKMIAYSGVNANCKSEFLYAITLRAIPIPNFTMPNGCLPKGEAQFINQSTFDGGTNGLTFAWDFGDPSSGLNNNSNLKDPIHQYKNAGNYIVNLTTTSANGCSATFSKAFVVNGAVPQPAFTVLNEKDLCSANVVVFNDVASLAFGELSKIEWFFDNDNQANNSSYNLIDNNPALRSEVTKSYSFLYPIFNSPISKIVNVKMKLYSGNGCESEIIKSIILKALPNVLFNNMPPVCEEVIPFQITQATETTGFIGTGIFSGKGISNTGLFSPAVAGVGTHTITFTFNGDNGCTDQHSKDIIVYPTPKVDAGKDETILIGGNIKFNATASGNNISYKWSPSVGLDNDAILNPTASPLVDTEYTLTITSENGCEVADKVFITVLKYPEIPNTFTPNGDGVNDTWEIKYLGSYPNSTIMIFNRYGKDVYKSESYTPWDGKLNGTNLPDGMYYYIITANSGQLKYTGSVLIIR